MCLNESNGPLKTSVSRKTICFDDRSSVKFIVVRKEFVNKLLKLLISVSGRVHTGNMSKSLTEKWFVRARM